MNSRLILAALLAATSLTAAAADNGFYAYGAYGWTESSRKSEADSVVSNLVTTFTSNADENDTGYKLQAGYRFNRYFALEGGYADLGKYTYDAVATVPVATRHVTVKVDAWNLGAVGRLPVTDSFTLFGKLGVADYNVKYRCDGTGVPCVNPDRSKRDATVHYGVGGEWNFTSNWFARAEYEVYQNVGDQSNSTGTTGVSKADIKMGSIGVGYRF